MFYGIRNAFNEATGIDLNEWTLVTKIEVRKVKSTHISLPFSITEMSLWSPLLQQRVRLQYVAS